MLTKKIYMPTNTSTIGFDKILEDKKDIGIIIANWAGVNLGDDAIFSALLNIIRNKVSKNVHGIEWFLVCPQHSIFVMKTAHLSIWGVC